MELTHVIIGAIVTEKAERLKAAPKAHTYTLRVHPGATKIEIQRALQKFYDVKIASVRVLWTQPKTRAVGAGTMEKRHRTKKALITLTSDSKPLDLTAFQLHS